MRDALKSGEVVVPFAAVGIFALVVLVIWIELPKPRYRYEKTKDPSSGIEHIWQIDEQTGQSSLIK
jgi:hypothetical protein